MKNLETKTTTELIALFNRYTKLSETNTERSNEFAENTETIKAELIKRVELEDVTSENKYLIIEKLISLKVSRANAETIAWLFGDGSWC